MWINARVIDWFTGLKEAADRTALASSDAVEFLKEELTVLRTERDRLKEELTRSTIMADWLRLKVNQLEFERTALIEQAYKIKLPAPEIVRHAVIQNAPRIEDFSFEDIGDEAAKVLGLPIYDLKN